jgi:hypothetical protein
MHIKRAICNLAIFEHFILDIYFSHGESQNDLNPNMLDSQSQLFVTEYDVDPNELWCLIPSQSKCLKCKSKCYYPSRLCPQPQPYNWFVSYYQKKKMAYTN